MSRRIGNGKFPCVHMRESGQMSPKEHPRPKKIVTITLTKDQVRVLLTYYNHLNKGDAISLGEWCTDPENILEVDVAKLPLGTPSAIRDLTNLQVILKKAKGNGVALPTLRHPIKNVALRESQAAALLVYSKQLSIRGAGEFRKWTSDPENLLDLDLVRLEMLSSKQVVDRLKKIRKEISKARREGRPLPKLHLPCLKKKKPKKKRISKARCEGRPLPKLGPPSDKRIKRKKKRPRAKKKRQDNYAQVNLHELSSTHGKSKKKGQGGKRSVWTVRG